MTPIDPKGPKFFRLPLGLVLGCVTGACGGSLEESGEGEPAASSLEVSIPLPDRPITSLETVEDYSEEVANRFIEFADKLRRRDFGSAADWVASDFLGHSVSGLAVLSEETLPLATRRVNGDASAAKVVDKQGFLGSFEALLGPWARVQTVAWKVKGAEFQVPAPLWGRIRFRVTLLGSGDDGGPRGIVIWGNARVEKRLGNWLLTGFELESFEEKARARAMFTDVATSAGVAHSGIRFGQPGNQSFAWEGAAGGDVNGDGLWDLFVPSEPHNFLYLGHADAEGNATFREVARASGVQSPAGGTGAVFFDYDNDGDQDLALADVGWKTGGNRLRLWRNDGRGRFEEVGVELGFDHNTHGFSLIVFDAEGDGWLDLFVCNYGRVDVESNNSWIQATNGTPNLLFHNEEGRGFREVAAERGLGDTGWSYAGAAADFDRDGDMDLYVANDYGVNQLWLNDGDGEFVDSAEAQGLQDLGNGMGASWGDMNADGILDLYVSNMSSTAGNRILARLARKDDTLGRLVKLAAGNSVFFSDEGDGATFERSPPGTGGIGGNWAWSSALVDLNLDGLLDVYCCSGFVTGDTPADT